MELIVTLWDFFCYVTAPWTCFTDYMENKGFSQIKANIPQNHEQNEPAVHLTLHGKKKHLLLLLDINPFLCQFLKSKTRRVVNYACGHVSGPLPTDITSHSVEPSYSGILWKEFQTHKKVVVREMPRCVLHNVQIKQSNSTKKSISQTKSPLNEISWSSTCRNPLLCRAIT